MFQPLKELLLPIMIAKDEGDEEEDDDDDATTISEPASHSSVCFL